VFPPLPPLTVAALVLVAALLASVLPRPPWLDRLAAWVGAASPLGWYLLGVVLGPVLHLLEGALLDACRPALAAALGWVAVRAGAAAAVPPEPDAQWTGRRIVATAGALLIPAALLAAAARWLPPEVAAAWKPAFPAIATLAAAMAVAASGDLRRTFPWVLIVTALASLWLLPHARRADLPRLAAWGGFAAAGVVLSGVLAARLRRGPAAPDPGTIAAIVLAGGLGLATRTSPLVVCGLLGAALARWSASHRELAHELAVSEPAVAAVLWVAAGALLGGPFPAVAVAAVALALTPLVWARLFEAAPRPNRTLALVVVLSFTLAMSHLLTAETATALVTSAALAIILVSAVQARPALHPGRLTSPTRAAEVSS
jgi:hypothetical protein